MWKGKTLLAKRRSALRITLPMRALAVLIAVLAACGREEEVPPLPPPPPARPPAPKAPRPPIIAFIRAGNVWTLNPDGSGARAVTSLKDAAAAHPAWSPDRRRIAFTASVDPDFQLTPRNVFTVPAEGGAAEQVTPMPRAGLRLEDAPKGLVRGRAFRTVDGVRVPAPGLRITSYGIRREAASGPDGSFQTFLPAGGGWVKLAGTIDDKRWIAWRFTPASEGKVSDLGDFVVSPGADDEPARPAWSADGQSLAYLARHTLIHRTALGGPVAIKTIRADGARDATIAEPGPAAIIAGPILQGGTAWFKTSDGRILRLDLDTRSISAVIDAGTGVPDALALSPDGATLATLRLDPSGAPTIVLVRGGKPEPLLTLAAAEGVPYGLDFSPDGTQLVLDRRKDGASDLWLLTIATKQWTRLTDDGASSDPVWHGR